jgi:penicillin-binding protein 2
MYYSQQQKQKRTQNRRTFFLFLGKLSIFSIIGWRLFNIQILDSAKYKTLSKNNQINVKILYPVRGEIKDRNGNIIATNKKVYDLYIIPEQTKNLKETLNNLKNFFHFDFAKKRKIILLSEKVKKFESIKIAENLNWEKLELIEANKNHLPGLHLQENYQRVYPQHKYFSHILGYISQPTPNDLNLPFISKMPNLDIGKTGLEKFFNEYLIGEAGNKEVEVNSSGKIIRQISLSPSKKGQNISISIDQRLQKSSYFELEKHKAGSIVVLNIKTGEILSMASIPAFDPNLIIKKPNNDYWQSLLNNPLSPLTNRSIQGLYSPGSTFKMVVALAGLKHKVINYSKTQFCDGKIEFGDRLYHCWKKKGHGSMNIENAIKESCDVFFYELSKKIGIDRIAQMAKEFGLGEKYQIGFENEKQGIVPSKKWKKEKLKESWYGGETLITGIGQGYLLATPLQLAVMTARIAANGKKIEPTIFKRKEKKEFDKITNLNDHIGLINRAMFKVVNEQKGTANRSKSEEYSFSGKTGTSQVKRITVEERESEDYKKKDIDWKNKDHALFVGYAPSENPKYAISVVIEHGGSGASTAAPIAKRTFDYIYKQKI